MRPQAVAAVLGGLWLLQRRQARKAKASQNPSAVPQNPAYAVTPTVVNTVTDSAPPSAISVRASASTPPSPKPILGAVLQWIFLILLGAAVALSAVKGTWDVFGLLVAAASMQLAGQMARWLGASSGRRGAGRAFRGAAGAALARAAEAAPPPRPVVHRPDPRLAGVWVKDASRSDPMDAAVAALRLNGLVRTAIKLIRGLQLDAAALAAGRFDMAIFSVIAWFKVRESYSLDGAVGHFNRRDLRRGRHAGSACVAADGSVLLSLSWGEPLAGSGTDHFALRPGQAGAAGAGTEPGGTLTAASEGDVLVVTSTIRLAGQGQPITYRTVYVRAGRGRHHQHHQGTQAQQQQAQQLQQAQPPEQQQLEQLEHRD